MIRVDYMSGGLYQVRCGDQTFETRMFIENVLRLLIGRLGVKADEAERGFNEFLAKDHDWIEFGINGCFIDSGTAENPENYINV